MTFKEFAYNTFVFPATVFSWLTSSVLGSNPKNDKNEYIVDAKTKEAVKYNGLFGWVADVFKAVARSIANFISNHKDAIAIAFWSSLVVGGAAALTVALWPAALTAAATFTIYGFSVAGIVGTGFAAQVAAIGGLAAVATSAATYAAAAVVNTITGIANFFSGRNKAPASTTTTVSAGEEYQHEHLNQSSCALGALSSKSSAPAISAPVAAPVHTASVLATPPASIAKVEAANEEAAAPATSMSI